MVAFPTAIFLSVHDGSKEHVTLAEGATQRVRLDQVAAVYTLGEEAQRGGVGPQDGLERLDEIHRMTPRFGSLGVIVGHTILTVGLAMVLMPTTPNLGAAAVLGLIVGALKVFNRDQPILSAPLSVVAALLVSTLVFLAVKYGLPVEPRYALVPPLVTFLPGAMLAFGLVELTYGDMMSGSSRLSTGIVQLVLLAFGLTAGALLVGYRPDNLLDGSREVAVPLWKSAAGVIVFGMGVFIHYSAPRRSLLWMLLVLLVAFAAQWIAALFVGPEISGFFGMLAATPLGNLIENRLRGPPSMVTFLPSFWLLVPGAHRARQRQTAVDQLRRPGRPCHCRFCLYRDRARNFGGRITLQVAVLQNRSRRRLSRPRKRAVIRNSALYSCGSTFSPAASMMIFASG